MLSRIEELTNAFGIDAAPRLMSDSPPAAFGRRFREARLKAGLSQQDVERLSGMPQQYISSVERGHENPTLESMTRLAEAVSQPLSELLRQE